MSSKRFASAVAYPDNEYEDPNHLKNIPEELLVYILGKMNLTDRVALRKVSMTDKLLHRHTTILLDNMYDNIVVSTRQFYHELTRQLYAETPPKTFPEEGEPIPSSWLTKFKWTEFENSATDSEFSNMEGVIKTIVEFLSSSEQILEHLDLSVLFWSFDTEMDPNFLPLKLKSALLVNDVITELNVSYNRIGPAGAVAIAEALRGMRS